MKRSATPALGALLALGLSASLTRAQPAPAQPPPPAAQPALPAGTPGTPGTPGAPGAPGAPLNPVAPAAQPGAAVAPPALPATRPDPVTTALAPQPGGLTLEEVGRSAVKTSASVRVKEAELRQAAARVDQALISYFPRLSLTATYTRLSENDPVSLGGGGYAVAGAQAPGPLLSRPCAPGSPDLCVTDSAGNPLGAFQTPGISFESFPNAYSLVASLSVPISDYVLRLSQGYAAATHAEEAKRIEVEARALQVAADAKLVFFDWVRAQGNAVVADESVAQARAHVADVRLIFEVGRTSRADVLRLEAQVANAEQFSAEARAFLAIAEERLRLTIGTPPAQRLGIGVDLMAAAPAPPAESLQALQQEALRKRLDIRALDETIYSLKSAENTMVAGYLPRVDAFANLTYANPNQRIFPSVNEFRGTWEAGVRASWAINDTFSNIGASAEAKARTEALRQQKVEIVNGLRLEVASAYADVMKAASKIDAADRQLVAAAESMRVRTELFRAGRATTVELVDAEGEVTRARLGMIDARIGLLVARTRLEHAVGRDVKASGRP